MTILLGVGPLAMASQPQVVCRTLLVDADDYRRRPTRSVTCRLYVVTPDDGFKTK